MHIRDTTRCPMKAPKSFRRAARPLAVAAAFVVATTSWAATPRFIATDLPDTPVDEDLWQYEYTLTGPIPAFAGLNIVFDSGRYAGLILKSLDPAAVLNVGLAQPDAGIDFNGQFWVQALSDLDASFIGKAQVSFIWSGDGIPGAQPFNRWDRAGFVIGSGVTAAVPEPGIARMLSTGIAALWLALRRRSAQAGRAIAWFASRRGEGSGRPSHAQARAFASLLVRWRSELADKGGEPR